MSKQAKTPIEKEPDEKYKEAVSKLPKEFFDYHMIWCVLHSFVKIPYNKPSKYTFEAARDDLLDFGRDIQDAIKEVEKGPDCELVNDARFALEEVSQLHGAFYSNLQGYEGEQNKQACIQAAIEFFGQLDSRFSNRFNTLSAKASLKAKQTLERHNDDDTVTVLQDRFVWKNDFNRKAISVADDLGDEMAYSFSQAEDEAGFVGDGTADYGHQTGVTMALSVAAGEPTTTSAGGIVVAAGNAYSEITLGNFNTVVGTLPDFAHRNARWFCSRKFYHDVMTRLLTAAGGNQLKDIENGYQFLFLGYPVEMSEVMPKTEANSQICCLFGDLALASTMGYADDIRVETSNSAYVNSESTFERDQIAVRGIQRAHIVVHDVGTTTTAGPIVGLQTLNA